MSTSFLDCSTQLQRHTPAHERAYLVLLTTRLSYYPQLLPLSSRSRLQLLEVRCPPSLYWYSHSHHARARFVLPPFAAITTISSFTQLPYSPPPLPAHEYAYLLLSIMRLSIAHSCYPFLPLRSQTLGSCRTLSCTATTCLCIQLPHFHRRHPLCTRSYPPCSQPLPL